MIVPEDAEPGIINPRLVKMSLDRRLIEQRLLKIYLGSSQVKAFFKIVSHGGTMDVLNLRHPQSASHLKSVSNLPCLL